ncbi:MAG: DUF2214 family protein [Pseudomonadota bacterium]
MNAFFAFLHHLAAFALVAALVVEMMLLKDALDFKAARKLQIADRIYGLSAAILLLVGLLRVFYFEKGAGYYFQSAPFIGKLALFVFVGLLSIYPTVKVLSWRASIKQGQVPDVNAGTLRMMRAVVHLELGGVVFILLFAALMARGIGFLGLP